MIIEECIVSPSMPGVGIESFLDFIAAINVPPRICNVEDIRFGNECVNRNASSPFFNRGIKCVDKKTYTRWRTNGEQGVIPRIHLEMMCVTIMPI